MAETKKKLAQDICEVLAVAMLAQLAEADGRLAGRRATLLMQDFDDYRRDRLSESELYYGVGKQYVSNLRTHLPTFYRALASKFESANFSFENVEIKKRNEKKKADFAIHLTSPKTTFFVSLKNYDVPKLGRVQVSSGTFNSFINNFVLVPDGIGMYRITESSPRFRGSDVKARDEAFELGGLGGCLSLFHKLDAINETIKERFVYSEEFAFLDEGKFDHARKEIGDVGSSIAFEILNYFEEQRPGSIRKRITSMSGLDGDEEILFLANSNFIDSVTSELVSNLVSQIRDPKTTFDYELRQQSIDFAFAVDGANVLSVNIPFTINKNGAWMSDVYEGDRFHKKENMFLRTAQRRPKKSKELATSINTYVDLSKLTSMFE